MQYILLLTAIFLIIYRVLIWRDNKRKKRNAEEMQRRMDEANFKGRKTREDWVTWYDCAAKEKMN